MLPFRTFDKIIGDHFVHGQKIRFNDLHRWFQRRKKNCMKTTKGKSQFKDEVNVLNVECWCACFKTVTKFNLSADMFMIGAFVPLCMWIKVCTPNILCGCICWMRAHQKFSSENGFSFFFIQFFVPSIPLPTISSNYNLLPVSFDRFSHKLSGIFSSIAPTE